MRLQEADLLGVDGEPPPQLRVQFRGDRHAVLFAGLVDPHHDVAGVQVHVPDPQVRDLTITGERVEKERQGHTIP